MAEAQSRSTVDAGEIARFSAIAAEWWDPRGKFRPLHKFNPVRLAFLRDRIAARFGRDTRSLRPFEGLRILDVGCGGGLLSEPMARLGADVVGIDAAERNIKTALVHAEEQGLAIDYRATTAEALAEAGESFDVVLAMEVVEHVADVPLFLSALSSLTRPDGMLFMATLNRTAKGFLFGIVGAEYVLRWLPRGTHDWRKFLRPSELAAGLRTNGMEIRELTGVAYDPFQDVFRLAPRDLDVNYMFWAAHAGSAPSRPPQG